jgi:hypothetical protein
LTTVLQNPSFFDADAEKTWVWNCNGELAPYDVDDEVFFLVMCSVCLGYDCLI